MAGRGAQQKSKPTKAEQKKNKSKSKAKDYWVSVFFCVIPYDSLKSYKKGKFKIGSKKFETVCYNHLGEPLDETGSYKKRKKYDLPLFVDCSDLHILENNVLDEEDLYSHLVLTFKDFYDATIEKLNKGNKLNVHFHIGCDTYCNPLRQAMRQVLTGEGANKIPHDYNRFAQFSRNYASFLNRYKEDKDKEWTFKVDYSAQYNLFVTYCPGLVTEFSPVEKKKREDKKEETAKSEQEIQAFKFNKKTDPNKPKAKFRIAGQDEDVQKPAESKPEQAPQPIKIKENKDPDKPKTKLKLAGEEQPKETDAEDDYKDLKLLDSNREEDKKSQEKKRTQADVDADLHREGKKNPKVKSIRVKDTSGTWVHYTNPYYDGPLERDDKIQLL